MFCKARAFDRDGGGAEQNAQVFQTELDFKSSVGDEGKLKAFKHLRQASPLHAALEICGRAMMEHTKF